MPNDAYGGWTPLRKALRKLDLNDTLGVIRAYSAFRTLRTRTPFPTDMEVHPSVYSNKGIILPWEMEVLAREAIIVCSPQPTTSYTARKWNTFSSMVNKLREVNDYISRYLVNDKHILQEVTVRLAHQQFKYQTEVPSKASLVRYSRADSKSEDWLVTKAALYDWCWLVVEICQPLPWYQLSAR